MVKADFAVIKTKTITVDNGRNALIDIAVVQISHEDFTITNKYHTVVNPERQVQPDSQAGYLTGQIPPNAPTLDDIAPALRNLFAIRKIVGYNFTQTDVPTLNNGISQQNAFIFSSACIDLLRLSREFLPLEHHSVEELHAYYKISTPTPTTTLDEAVELAEIFIAMMEISRMRQYTYKKATQICDAVREPLTTQNWVAHTIQYSHHATVTTAAATETTKQSLHPQDDLRVTQLDKKQIYYPAKISKSGKPYRNHFAVIDLETTGLNWYEDEILEVAVVLMDSASLEITGQYHTLVKPEHHSDNPAEKINRIPFHILQDAPTLTQVTPQLKELLAGRKLIGHNLLGYDINLLNYAFAKYYTGDPDYPKGYTIGGDACVDTLMLARTFLEDVTNNKLLTVAAHYGIDYNENAHMALADTLATAEVFRFMSEDPTINQFVNRSCTSWCDGWAPKKYNTTGWKTRTMPTETKNAATPIQERTADEQEHYYRTYESPLLPF